MDASRSCCESGADTGSDVGASGGSGGSGGSAGGTPNDAGLTDVTDAALDADASGDASSCDVVVEERIIEGATHIPDCTTQTYASNPPSSGPHWGTSAAHGVYSVAIPRESLVHNLEHGAVVIWYNCSANCADVSRAEAFVSSLPVDPLCPQSGPARRVILVPDPLLDVPIAASAWGFTLRASCFDEQAFADFFSAHYGRGPEGVCFDGWDFETANGKLVLPPSCP